MYDNLVGHKITDISIYETAFTHSSAGICDTQGNHISNERLEYLGDAIIEAVVSDVLYRDFKTDTEGTLTKLRAKIVQRDTLNEIAEKMGLEHILKINTHSENKHNKDILGNALEALVGAIYLDLGYGMAHHFVCDKIVDSLDRQQLCSGDRNYKSQLLEWGQKHKINITFDTNAQDRRLDNQLTFYSKLYVEGRKESEAWGYTKKESQQQASKYFLEYIRKHRNYETEIIRKKNTPRQCPQLDN